MGNTRSSSSSATSSYCQSAQSIPIKNFNDNERQFWKKSISARESFENSQQQKEEAKNRLKIRNRSLVLFQQPKLVKNGGRYGWWPLKRMRNRCKNIFFNILIFKIKRKTKMFIFDIKKKLNISVKEKIIQCST